MKVSALIPAHNEIGSIRDVVVQCGQYVSNVLVIDDGSTDSTASAARSAGAHVLKNSTCHGYGHSLRRGIEYLYTRDTDTVVTLDADGVHDPNCIPSLLQSHLGSNADLTVGSRLLDGCCAESLPSAKYAANRFATSAFNKVADSDLTDVASGMRVFGKAIMEIPLDASGFNFTYELLTASLNRGLGINETPIGVQYDVYDLHYTEQTELLEAFTFIIQHGERTKESFEPLRRARKDIDAFKKLGVEVCGDMFVLHPLPDYTGYIFQLQSSRLRKRDSSRLRYLKLS